MKPKKTKETGQTSARRAAPRPRTPSMSETLHDHIVKRAFEIYQRRILRGPLDDWLQAEQEILQEQHPHAEYPREEEE